MLTTWQELGAAGAGLCGGVLSGFFGVGGNIILVPLLAVVLGLTQQQAQGITLAALLPPLALPAIAQYRKGGVPLLWKVVGWCILGFLPAIPIGSALANVLPGSALRLMFATLLLINAARIWAAKPSTLTKPHLEVVPAGALPICLTAGFTAGLASGLLGIGGAIVLIPQLTRRLGMSQQQAQVTSLAMLLPPVALPGVLVYAQAQGGLPWGALMPVALGFIVGAFIGGRFAQRISAARLTRGFAGLLTVAAVLLVVKAVDSMLE